MRAEFEIGANHRLFVREMEGWWLACRKGSETGSGYAFESEVNRIAAAYWRDHDASVLAHMRGVFESLQSHVPSPLPAGKSVVAYYDAHCPDKLKRECRSVSWFQARMCLSALDERPGPTFAQALEETASCILRSEA